MVKCTASVGKCWEARSFKLALAISCIVFVAVIVVVIVIFLVTLIGEFCSSTLGHYLFQVSFSSETFLEVMCVGITIIPVFFVVVQRTSLDLITHDGVCTLLRSMSNRQFLAVT